MSAAESFLFFFHEEVYPKGRKAARINECGDVVIEFYRGKLDRPVCVHLPSLSEWEEYNTTINAEHAVGFAVDLDEELYKLDERDYREPHLYLEKESGADGVYYRWKLVDEGGGGDPAGPAEGLGYLDGEHASLEWHGPAWMESHGMIARGE